MCQEIFHTSGMKLILQLQSEVRERKEGSYLAKSLRALG